jgi:nitroreductase
MNVSKIDALALREVTPGSAVAPMFPRRWSPRAMAGTALTEDDLRTLFEAARWAPSCFNAQPWRFAYALRDTEHWEPLFTCLTEGNQAWVRRAGALIAVITRSEYERNGKPAPTHSFDGGAAWMSIALQAAELGLVAHAMRGFDNQAVRVALSVPEVFDLPAIIAVGHPGEIEDLTERHRERESPSSRKPLEEFVFEGNFREMTS